MISFLKKKIIAAFSQENSNDHRIKIVSCILFSLIVFASVVLNIYFIWKPFSYLITHKTPDDTYYYLKIASNFAAGKGITFDGVNPTNGFHPLWFLLITPIMFITHNLIARVYIVLALGALFNIASIFLFYRLSKKLNCGIAASLCAVTLFALNPFLLLANSGLETPLAIFLEILLLLLWIPIFQRKSKNLKSYLLFGAVAGLTLLSRLDSIFFVSLVFVAFALCNLKRLRYVLAAGATTILIVLPYLIWDVVTFHHLVPVSGRAVPFVIRETYFRLHGHADVLAYLHHWYVHVALAHCIDTLLASSGFFYAILGIGISLAVIRKRYDLLTVLLVCAGTIFIYPGYSVFVRWAFRYYYSYSMLPLMMIIALIFVDSVLHFFRERIAIILIATILSVYLVVHAYQINIMKKYQYWPWQISMYRGSLWLSQYHPNERVASFDAGINGYFYRGTVFNIDGVVNNEAFRFIKKGMLMQYLLEQHIHYYADFECDWHQLQYEMGTGFQKHMQTIWVMRPTIGTINHVHYIVAKII